MKPYQLQFIIQTAQATLHWPQVDIRSACFNQLFEQICYSKLIYLVTTSYQFLFLSAILMFLLYLAAPFLITPSCFCLTYHIFFTRIVFFTCMDHSHNQSGTASPSAKHRVLVSCIIQYSYLFYCQYSDNTNQITVF